MTTPIQPTDQPWQLQMGPEGWQQVLMQARKDLHANPNDQEALQAIRDANDALNVYEDASVASPGERLSSGFETGLADLAESVKDIPRGIGQLVGHPIETLENLPNVPGQLAEGLSGEHPARAVGNIGAMLLPFAKTSKAAGAPTVGAVTGRAMSAPFRAAGNLLERPGLKNALLRTQQELAQTRKAGQQLRNEQIIPQQAEQAGLRTEAMKTQAGQAATKSQAALKRIELMSQQAERGPATAENLQLRNDLLRLKLELAGEGGEGAVPQASSMARPSTIAEKAPDALRNLTDEQLAQQPHGQTPPLEDSFGAEGIIDRRASQAMKNYLGPERRNVTSLEEIINRNAQPKALDTGTQSTPQFEEGLPPVSPSRFIGPQMSKFDIDTYLRQIAKASEKGYQ